MSDDNLHRSDIPVSEIINAISPERSSTVQDREGFCNDVGMGENLQMILDTCNGKLHPANLEMILDQPKGKPLSANQIKLAKSYNSRKRKTAIPKLTRHEIKNERVRASKPTDVSGVEVTHSSNKISETKLQSRYKSKVNLSRNNEITKSSEQTVNKTTRLIKKMSQTKSQKNCSENKHNSSESGYDDLTEPDVQTFSAMTKLKQELRVSLKRLDLKNIGGATSVKTSRPQIIQNASIIQSDSKAVKALPLKKSLPQQVTPNLDVHTSDRAGKFEHKTTTDPKKTEKTFNCEICDRMFRFSQNLASHKRTHFGVKKFSCAVCKKKFSRNHNLVFHMQTHISDKPKIHECTLCDKSFPNTLYLSRHTRTHLREKQYQCNLCDKAYVYKRGLVDHMHSHTGYREYNYKCEICGKLFQHSNSLKVHQRNHTEQKKYPCGFCDKSFTRTSSLKVHNMMVHTGDKRHQCPVCAKSFSGKSCLRSHISIHSGDGMLYPCNMCGKSYKHATSLRTHMHSHATQNK